MSATGGLCFAFKPYSDSSENRCRDDHGTDRFAPFAIGDTDDSGFADLGWVDDLFDLARVDVGAAGDDDVFGAIGQVQLAIASRCPI